MKRLFKVIAVLALIVGTTITMSAQFNPHGENGTYKENFRGQVHFSPKTGWMNDINGLVYQGGQYNMIYQWGKRSRQGGYATSKDLIHWTDKGIALIPQGTDTPGAVPNVTGAAVFSGSAVVVSGDIAKGITGSTKEAIVAIYTGTTKGTCLAWSNDGGETWHDYPGNPVANPAQRADPRDPCVFFHKETDQWIMALYEKGTSFYGSKDLIHWNFISNIDFGYECPDIFKLPVDGDKNNIKWVLMDANGSYLVGDFDGKEFKPSDQGVLEMTLGYDFYAAQSFPMAGEPGGMPNGDPRKIQIAWMDHWNGGLGESVWERNAAFPVELGLKTYEGKIRITRKPIDEIKTLYTNDRSWEAQTVTPDSQLFEKVYSKVFVLTAEFDLNGTTANSFGFQIQNKKVAYHVKSQVFLDEQLKPDTNGHIKVTLIIDWGQLEAFANDGIFSYSESFAFSPDGRGEVSFFTDGDIKLVSMEMHDLKSIWE